MMMISLSRCPRWRRRWEGEERRVTERKKSPAVEDFARHSGKGAHDAAATTAAGKERGTRSKRARKSTAVEEDFARYYSVEDAQDAAAAGKEGDKEGCRRRGGDKE